jgi:hypothetical protein
VQEFKLACKMRFSLIDVKKHQSASKKNKKPEDIDIHNEMKLITASDEVYDLWAEVISGNSQGELIDPDTCKHFKHVKGWSPDRDGVINREFFKWMGNVTENDLKRLALHLLNRTPNRPYAHPKVTMKAAKSVLPDCYSAKEWLDRVKRKAAVKIQFHHLNPKLKLFDNEGNSRREGWKNFKKAYNVNKATKNTLLSAPGEVFFSQAKLTMNKKKTIDELSPMAAEFFKVFLASKGKFQRPQAKAYYRPYEMKDDELGDWDAHVWDGVVESGLKMAIIDFRNIPGVIYKGSGAGQASYFDKFLGILEEDKLPSLTDPDLWLWIAGEKDVELDLRGVIRTTTLGTTYTTKYADYIPSAFERIGDVPERSSRAKDVVQLIFLVKTGANIKPCHIPRTFQVPPKSHYNTKRQIWEVEYRIYDTELRMEFYLSVLDLFLSPGDKVLSYFGGGKVICAAWVSLFNSNQAKFSGR